MGRGRVRAADGGRGACLMPRISFFYGIAIWMYFNEGVHAQPHFHARYRDYEASMSFNGEVIVGWLPTRALRLVQEWTALHADELQANWSRARAGGALLSIDPLA